MNQMTPVVAGGLTGLRAPFPAHQISKLPKPYKKDSPKGNCPECGGYHALPAMHLDYVGHAALTDRLLDTDPAWTWEPVAFNAAGLPAVDNSGGLWIRLTVNGVTRLGYGSADGKTGGNAVKEMIGDALRNAAMRFGAALDLWHKGDLHLDDEDAPEPASAPAPTQDAPAIITDAQYAHIVGLIEGSAVSAKEVCEKGGITALENLRASKFNGCVRWINDEIKARGPASQASDDLMDGVPY